MEDKFNRQQPPWKMTLEVDNLNRRLPQWKTTSMEDKLFEIEENLIKRQPN